MKINFAQMLLTTNSLLLAIGHWTPLRLQRKKIGIGKAFGIVVSLLGIPEKAPLKEFPEEFQKKLLEEFYKEIIEKFQKKFREEFLEQVKMKLLEKS